MANPELPPLSEIPNPMEWTFTDYRDTFKISIKVNWDSSDGELMSAVVFRDPECLLNNIVFGLGPDGTVESSPDQWVVPAGETLVRRNFLMKARLRTVYDVLTMQITAY